MTSHHQSDDQINAASTKTELGIESSKIVLASIEISWTMSLCSAVIRAYGFHQLDPSWAESDIAALLNLTALFVQHYFIMSQPVKLCANTNGSPHLGRYAVRFDVYDL